MVPVLDTLDRGETYVIEVTNRRAAGTRFPVEVHSASLLFDGREALVQALNGYSGAVVVVTHDRHMLELIADRLVLVDGGRASPGRPCQERLRAALRRRWQRPVRLVI